MIEFSTEEKQSIVSKIQRYFKDELGREIGRFDAEFLLDFFAREIGGHFYNRGLSDARTILQSRLENIDDALYEIEKPVD